MLAKKGGKPPAYEKIMNMFKELQRLYFLTFQGGWGKRYNFSFFYFRKCSRQAVLFFLQAESGPHSFLPWGTPPHSCPPSHFPHNGRRCMGRRSRAGLIPVFWNRGLQPSTWSSSNLVFPGLKSWPQRRHWSLPPSWSLAAPS